MPVPRRVVTGILRQVGFDSRKAQVVPTGLHGFVQLFRDGQAVEVMDHIISSSRWVYEKGIMAEYLKFMADDLLFPGVGCAKL